MAARPTVVQRIVDAADNARRHVDAPPVRVTAGQLELEGGKNIVVSPV